MIHSKVEWILKVFLKAYKVLASQINPDRDKKINFPKNNFFLQILQYTPRLNLSSSGNHISSCKSSEYLSWESSVWCWRKRRMCHLLRGSRKFYTENAAVIWPWYTIPRKSAVKYLESSSSGLWIDEKQLYWNTHISLEILSKPT